MCAFAPAAAVGGVGAGRGAARNQLVHLSAIREAVKGRHVPHAMQASRLGERGQAAAGGARRTLSVAAAAPSPSSRGPAVVSATTRTEAGIAAEETVSLCGRKSNVFRANF